MTFYTFANATTSIPLANLDANFATPITLGNTAVTINGTFSSIGNLTLNNATIASGNSTVTKETVTTITSPAATNLTIQSAGTTAMTIDTSQNVGIGTSSPSYKLEVQGSANTYLGQRIYNTNSGSSAVSYLQIGNDSNGATAQLGLNSSTNTTNIGGANGLYLANGLSAPIAFATAGSERMRIDTAGNLLVGTTSSSYGQSGLILNPSYNVAGSSGIAIQHQNGSSSGGIYLGFTYNSSVIGSVSQNGTTGVLYNITSDQRLKTNIVDAPSASSIIDAIQIRSFDWKSDGSHNRYGVIAQELNQLVPEAVHTPIDENEMMGVDYSKLVPLLVKALQELKAEFDAYKASHP